MTALLLVVVAVGVVVASFLLRAGSTAAITRPLAATENHAFRWLLPLIAAVVAVAAVAAVTVFVVAAGFLLPPCLTLQCCRYTNTQLVLERYCKTLTLSNKSCL